MDNVNNPCTIMQENTLVCNVSVKRIDVPARFFDMRNNGCNGIPGIWPPTHLRPFSHNIVYVFLQKTRVIKAHIEQYVSYCRIDQSTDCLA